MEDPQQLQQAADDDVLTRILRGGQISAAESKVNTVTAPRLGRAVAQADDLVLQKILAQPQPTAAHEAIMRDGGTDFATADKMVKSGAAAHVAHLPPAVPTAKAPIDQIAAQYEVLKASGDLAKLSPEDYAVFTAPLKAAHWEVGPDYIKPPSAAPGAYPLWERQIAGQLKQGELPQGQAWYERTALGRTARKVFEPIGGMIEQGAKAAGESVVGTLKGDPFAQAKALKKIVVDPQLAELQRGYDMWEAQGGHDSPESIAHGLAGLIPFLGPVAASFGEKAGTGIGKVTAGDTRGWEDIIGSIPDAVMLAAPLITKGFEAMKSGVPAEQAMSDVASQLRPLLEKRLRETIAPEGPLGTGAKPKIVLPREEASYAGERPQVLSQAGPTGEARGGVGDEGGQVTTESPISRIRNRKQAKGQKEVAPTAARETITPAEDTPVGQNAAGEQLYERANGDRYRMRYDSPNTRPNGYPDFGGDLAIVEGPTREQIAAQHEAGRVAQAQAAGEVALGPEDLGIPRGGEALPEPTTAQRAQAAETHQQVIAKQFLGEPYPEEVNRANQVQPTEVNRLRDSQQAEGSQGQVAPPANLSRNFRAGTNDATLTFASETQRDLYDLAANERYAMRGGQNKTSQHAVRDTAAMKARLADQLGISEAEVSTLARKVHDDVKVQMKGVGHLEERAITDNVLGEQQPPEVTNAQEPATQVLRPDAAAGPQEAPAGQISQAAANRQGEGQVATETRPLGFAQQLADHELPSGDAMTYEATPGKFFDANRAKARENIAQMGDKGAEHYVTSEGGAWTDERMSTAAMLIRKLDALGDIEGANRVASAAAQRALEAGRASAAADLGRLTPEGVLFTAQKVAKQRGVELSPELAAEASQRGAEARATFENFTQVEREIDRNGGQKAVQAAAQGKKLNLADRLDAAATQARTRLAERQAKMREGSLKEFGSGGLSTEELLDYATIGAAKIARGATDFGKWSREMLAEYGDSIRPHLKAIFNASAEQWHGELKADRTAKLNRQAEAVQAAAPGLDRAAAENLIAQRAAARAADSRAKMQLAQTLDKINGGSPILRGLKRGAFELSTLPQTIKTAFDLSMTLRQGGAFSITEPRLSAEAFKKSVKAFGSEKAYEVGVDYIASHPRFDQMRAADLRLDTLRAHPESVIGRSEFYPSEIGRRIPGVHQSARAAEMMMDTQRVETFDKFAGELERKAAESGEAVTPEQYKGLARWINIWSGRAPQLGGKLGALTQVLPWWSPGWVYSRVQLLNPAYALSLPKGVRAIAFRKTAQLYGTYTAAAGVIAASNAMLPENQRLKVSFDPDDPDFFKAKGGWLGEHTRVSLLPPGTQPQARFIARVGKHATLAAMAEQQGDTKERTKQASEVGKTIERFNFSKLTPVVGTAYGLMFNKGKNYIGEPITPSKAGEDIIEPMSVNDIIDAYKAEGLGGALKEAPASILGADVQIYKRQPVDPKKFKAMPMETAVDVYRRAAPEDRAKLRRQLIEKRNNALQHAKTLADRRRIYAEFRQAVAAQ